MREKFTIEEKRDYLYIILLGEFSREEFLKLIDTFWDECNKRKKDRLLLNALKIYNPDIPKIERFALGEKIAKLVGYKIKISVVWPKKYIDNFAETVAVNRGSRMFVHDDLDIAREWLLK